MKFCLRCDNTGWLCEAHPNLPWIDSPRGCRCGAPGDPCPCNSCSIDEPPTMGPGFEADVTREPPEPLDAREQSELEEDLARINLKYRQ
jgi:hypothetical protein